MQARYLHPKKWILKSYSNLQLKRWYASLKYFYLFIGYGGHANEEDTFRIQFKFKDKEELLFILKKICISDKIIKEISNTVYIDPSFTISNHILIECGDFFCLIENNYVNFSIVGTLSTNKMFVNENDWIVCKDFEKLVDEKGLDKYISYDIHNDERCISSENYPYLKLNNRLITISQQNEITPKDISEISLNYDLQECQKTSFNNGGLFSFTNIDKKSLNQDEIILFENFEKFNYKNSQLDEIIEDFDLYIRKKLDYWLLHGTSYSPDEINLEKMLLLKHNWLLDLKCFFQNYVSIRVFRIESNVNDLYKLEWSDHVNDDLLILFEGERFIIHFGWSS